MWGTLCQGLVKPWPGLAACFFLNKVLLKHIHIHYSDLFYVLSLSAFNTVRADLTSFNTDCMAHKA